MRYRYDVAEANASRVGLPKALPESALLAYGGLTGRELSEFLLRMACWLLVNWFGCLLYSARPFSPSSYVQIAQRVRS